MGRHLQLNALDLDAEARVAGTHAWGLRCILIFLDFAAAFPMLSQRFLMLIIELIGFPRGFVNLIRGFYCLNAARCPLTGLLLPGRRPPLLSLTDGASRRCGMTAAARTRPAGWLSLQAERGPRAGVWSWHRSQL